MGKATNSHKSLWVAGLAVLLLLGAFIGLQSWFGKLDEKLVQYEKYEQAPEFNLPVQKHVEPSALSAQKTIGLDDLKGRAFLLHFWASWCQPCREERPMLQELVNQHHDGSLSIIGVASYESAASLANSGLLPETPFTVLLDEEGDTAQNYKVRAIPQSVLIDGMGRVRYRVKGALTLNEIAAIEAALIVMRQEESHQPKTAVNP